MPVVYLAFGTIRQEKARFMINDLRFKNENKTEFITKNASETEKIGSDFAQKVKSGSVILLFGELGSGKTTFVRGFVAGLEFENRVISPTFMIVRQYEPRIKNPSVNLRTSHESGIQKIYHLDLYRFKNKKDLNSLDLKEMLEDKNAVTLIEWPELIQQSFSKNSFEIQFSYINENERRISVNNKRIL